MVGIDHLEDRGLHESIIFKWIFGKWSGGIECIEVDQDGSRRLEMVNAESNLGYIKSRNV